MEGIIAFLITIMFFLSGIDKIKKFSGVTRMPQAGHAVFPSLARRVQCFTRTFFSLWNHKNSLPATTPLTAALLR